MLLSMPFINREHEMPCDIVRFTSSGVTHVIKEAGFGEVRVSKVGNRWFTLYDLWSGSSIGPGETFRFGHLSRLLRQILRYTLVPLLNISVFTSLSRGDDSVYHHLFVSAIKA